MEEPGAGARGPEDHAADAARLRGAEDALSAGAAPEPATAAEVCGAPEARLPAEVDQEKGGDFAVGLVAPVEAVSASTEGRRLQIGQGKGSSLEQRDMYVEEEKGVSLAPASQSSAEPGGLQTCHEANGGLPHKTLCAPKDTGCMHGMLEETAEGSQLEQEGLVGNGDGKTGQFGGISGDSMMCHVSDGGMWNVGLCAAGGKGSQFIDSRCMYDTVDMATEGSPCQQGILAGGRGVSSGVVEDSQTCYEEPHCGNEGLPDLVNRDIEQLPCSMGATCLKKNANRDLEKDGLSNSSWTLHEHSVPSISGHNPAVSLDGKTGRISELPEHMSSMENVAYSAEVCGTFSCESAFHKEAPEVERRFSGRKVSTSEEDLRTDCMEAAHDNGDLSDLGKHHSEKLLCGADGPPLMTGANHELEKVGFLPNINSVASCPIDETSVPSVYGSSIDVPLDRKVGQAVDTSEISAGFEKLVCDSLGGELTLCDSGLRTEAYGDENQHSGPHADKELQHTPLKYGSSELSPEGNLCVSSYNQPCDDEPCCSGKESSALCLGHQDSAVGRSGHLDQGLNAGNCADDSSVDFVSNANDGASQSQKLTALNVFRRRNPKRAASSRRDSERPNQMNQASSSTCKPKKVDVASPLQQSTTNLFPNKIAKGRSGMNRPPKPSTWGSLKELLDGFCQSCRPSTSNSHPTYLDKGRSDNISDQKSQPSIRRSRSSRSSKSKFSSMSVTGYAASELNGQSTLSTVVDIGHAASELNEQPAFSTVADTDVSLESRRQNIPKLSSDTSINIFDSTSNTAESTDSYRTVKSKCIQTDAQQLERALVSSTKETFAADVHGECAKLSTSESSLTNAKGSAMLHVEFSPDSVLEVASVTCEGNASASHDVMLHENSTNTGALNVGDYHPSVSSTSNFGKEQALLSLMSLEQQAKTTLHDDTRKKEIDPSHAMVDNDVGEGKAQALQKSNAVRKIRIVRKPGCKKKDGSKGKRKNVIGSTKISPCEASKHRPFSSNSISPDPSESILCTRPPEFSSCFEALTSGTQDHAIYEHDSIGSHSVMDGDRGSAFDSTKSPRRKKKDANTGKKKGKAQDPHKKEKSKKKNIADDTSFDHGLLDLPSSDLAASRMNEQSNFDPATEFELKNSSAMSAHLPGNAACKTDGASVPPRAAWVCCDDCQKWRCIPAELVDVIGETRWTCKDNGDKAFANCSIPQEKTNAEINAELDLSDASADEADDDRSNSKACKAPSWTSIRSNLFLHRQRRTQSIDESMVCNCKPPQDGRQGCRDGCLNRMLNIECVKRTCPCGEHCSNQKRRSYSKLRWFHSGKKGYGLQLQEDVSEGRFLIEYVGEVLDITSYESRQRYYASKGQKHFYFMALNGGEVIDACTKGNLGRFINHSCSPNCRTEKWMVNGEVCIGIFAMRNIKKGEELTFDYNYVRVSGAAPQKCFCGTAKCRGYIGGDISVVDTFTQDDAEAGHFEQMIPEKDSEELMGANGSDSDGSLQNIAEPEFSIQGEDLHDCSVAKELEPLEQTGGTVVETCEPENSLEAWSPQEDEDVIRTPVHVSRTFESSLQQFPVHGPLSSDLLLKTANSVEGSKAPNVINGSTPSSDFRSNLVPGFNASKRNNLKQHRNVKPQSLTPIDNEHILGVEGRLNNLLDGNGGISKRKDATNGYLKLLFVTAAEGDSAGGTSKSVRDLSLILDALLKTKSRSVLLDIINKNGLQMLHNILKQNRTDFHRIPIIRKLLKVLEFLAQKGILTSEHINGGPRCAGVESFRDSMLSLIRHKNFQVQQIARSFRDRWILYNNARSEPTEYPHTSTSAQDIQGTNMVWSSARRKRKSRWDYQPDEHYKMVGLKIQKVFSGHGEFDVQFGFTRNKLQRNQGTNNCYNGVHHMESSTEGADDDVPPGFETKQECQPPQLSIGSEVAPGLCMERCQPSLSVSYGVPVTLGQHFGTPDSEGGQCHQKWKVAPGVPSSPFLPLPTHPRGSPCPSTASSHMFQPDGTSPVNHSSSGNCGRTAGRDGRVHRTWRNGPRIKWPYHQQGRRFSSNHHRFERIEPPRPQ
ncbi:uncharacterized protein C2845_PM12G17070 [Panicum miliaceum]|uniref:Histone-lysine N-methyltransferase ASHH2 n=1 Tax=Panicum miliaceum TaxID=4540 RepID=A0A3L6QG70_PANMI|nr:uncharacterized protein C2845_PM12G17070 [Panicum miliaceum]